MILQCSFFAEFLNIIIKHSSNYYVHETSTTPILLVAVVNCSQNSSLLGSSHSSSYSAKSGRSGELDSTRITVKRLASSSFFIALFF